MVNCPDTTYTIDHRELDPVWCLHYLGEIPNDNSNALVPFTLSMSPAGMPGEVTFSSDAKIVRLWKTSTKGKANILPNEETFAASAPPPPSDVKALPQTFYVEGIHVGDAGFEVEYTPPDGVVIPGEIEVTEGRVVSLVETQGGRKVIYECSPPEVFVPDPFPLPGGHPGWFNPPAGSNPIVFTVEGGEAFNGNGSDVAGEYTWSVINYNNLDALADKKDNSISVSYGKAGECDVTVIENADNRRFTNTVSVSLGTLNLTRTVRVALNTYPTVESDPPTLDSPLETTPNPYSGNPVPSTEALHKMLDFRWDDRTPVTFSDLRSTDLLQGQTGENRIFLHSGLNDPARAFYFDVQPATDTLPELPFNVCYVGIGLSCWERQISQRIFKAIIAHEIMHLEQFAAIRDNPESLWARLYAHHENVLENMEALAESSAYFLYLKDDADLDWYFIRLVA